MEGLIKWIPIDIKKVPMNNIKQLVSFNNTHIEGFLPILFEEQAYPSFTLVSFISFCE